jgi:hypothetical protein
MAVHTMLRERGAAGAAERREMSDLEASEGDRGVNAALLAKAKRAIWVRT